MNKPRRDRSSTRSERQLRAIAKLFAEAMLVSGGIAQLTGCSKPAATTEAPVAAPTSTPAPPTVVAAPVTGSPQERWEKLAGQVQADIDASRYEDAAKQLTELAKVFVAPATPDETQTKQLATLTAQLQEKRKSLMAEERVAKLAEAQALFNEGKYTEASAAASFVLNRAPTLEQESLAKSLSAASDERRRARSKMQNSMRFLASDDPREVAAARIELPQQAEVSMPLLAEASADPSKPKLVSRAIALMVQLDRPATSIPAIVGVLKRAEQKENWPDAIDALEKMNRPGAGEPLLELALTAPTPEGKIAALTALSKVADIPPRTVIALLPLLGENSPTLAAALTACLKAVRTLDQTDLTVRRNVDVPLTSEDEQRLTALPQRLLQLAAGGDGITPEAVQQAKALANAVHLLPAEPLKGVKILRSGSELPESPAAAVLDGVWNSIEPATMWCYPVTGRGTIMLDLGEERTVVGVRIWNINTPAAAATLGWKDIRVIVSVDPSEVKSPKLGIVPPAPGTAASPDYSVTIPINSQRGRYVEISANSLWTTPTGEGNTGLSEIQILGF